MSTIDKQRIAAVRKLEQLGYTYASDDWMHPTNDAAPAPAITDALDALLIKRADDLEGCTEGSDEKRELEAITNAIEAYEAVRWPSGKVNGGRGSEREPARRHPHKALPASRQRSRYGRDVAAIRHVHCGRSPHHGVLHRARSHGLGDAVEATTGANHGESRRLSRRRRTPWRRNRPVS
jgi:hypothetical protein